MSAGDQDLFGTMIKVENKDIFVDLRQNSGGVYLKLSERNGKSRSTILIPASGINRLKAVLEEVSAISSKNPRVSAERKNRIVSDPGVVSRSVYVTGLAWTTDKDGLTAHFSSVAPVKNATILYKNRGGIARSLGCGVVEFNSQKDAINAVKELDESALDGRTIKCREDRNVDESASAPTHAPAPAATTSSSAVATTTKEKNPRKKRSTPASSNDNTNNNNNNEQKVAVPTKVFVASLSFDSTNEDLSAFFSNVGEVVNAEVLMTRKGRSQGRGIVEFAAADDAADAIERLNGKELQGRAITVREYYNI